MSDTPPINLSPDTADVQDHLEVLASQLASLQDQVRGLQRLAGLGTMSAMLAHEINNILTPIVSYGQYALQRNDPELLRTAVEKTLANSKRLTGLCTRVLGLAAESQAGLTATPIAPLVADAVECLGRDLAKDNITLHVHVPADLTARVHAGGLQQVLFNLVLNARQAMLDRRGELTITGERADGDRVRITVRDNGPGIPAEHVTRVFEPFFSTKQHQDRADKRGVGLGLAICRQIMSENGGTIDVHSVPGQGATFTLTLPSGDPATT